MTSYLLVGPADEPVSLARAKAHLRLDDDAEDALVEALVAAARAHIEAVTGSAMLAQTWRMVCDDLPWGGVLVPPVSPLLSLEAVRAYDADNVATVLDVDAFSYGARVTPAEIAVPSGIDDLPELRAHRAFEVDFIAGFGEEPEDVPADLTQAMLTLIAYWFAHRDAVAAAGAGMVIPAGFDRLISPYKRVRL